MSNPHRDSCVGSVGLQSCLRKQFSKVEWQAELYPEIQVKLNEKEIQVKLDEKNKAFVEQHESKQ